MRPVAILGLGVVAPPPGQTKVTQIGDEADKAAKRLPRLDRMALKAAREALGSESTAGMGLVVGTGYGGLSATVEFLEGLAIRGAAFGSPTAFHQSVHHSPAGQLSLALKITGPSLTCSSRELSGEAALREGMDLIGLKRCDRVLVVCTDEVVPALEAAFRAFEAPWAPAEGAAAVLLGREGSALELVSVALASQSTSLSKFSRPPAAGTPLNPSEGLIRVVETARRLEPGQTEKLQSAALGGGEAVIELRRR